MICVTEIVMQNNGIKIKVALLGDGAVGLTSMLKMYLYQEIFTDYNPTILDKYEVKLQVKNKIINLEIVDTPGQENFADIRSSQFADLDAVMIVYSAVSSMTLAHIESIWWKELKDYFGTNLPEIVLVQNKCDLLALNDLKYKNTSVNPLRAQEMRKKINAFSFFDCSATDIDSKYKVDKTFESLIVAALFRKGFIKKQNITKYTSSDFLFLESPEKIFSASLKPEADQTGQTGQNQFPLATVELSNKTSSTEIPVAMAIVVSQDSRGVNGLTKSEIEYELTRFYVEHDAAMLAELEDIVNWSMINSLEALETLLIDRFGHGLPLFDEGNTMPENFIRVIKVDKNTKVVEAVPSESNSSQAAGINGLSKKQIEAQLRLFYTKYDPDMLVELTNLVDWCMVNGLEEFDKLLLERFGRGLPMFESEPT